MLAYIMLYFAFALHIPLENRSPQEQDRREYIMLRGFGELPETSVYPRNV